MFRNITQIMKNKFSFNDSKRRTMVYLAVKKNYQHYQEE